MIRTPRHPAWLWVGAIAVYASWPFAMAFYFRSLLASGTLPPDGDSIAIPIGGCFLLTLIAAPFAILTLWLSLRRYRGHAPLSPRPRTRTDVAWTLFYVLIAILEVWMTAGITADIWSAPPIIHALAALALLPFLHAASIGNRAGFSPA